MSLAAQNLKIHEPNKHIFWKSLGDWCSKYTFVLKDSYMNKGIYTVHKKFFSAVWDRWWWIVPLIEPDIVWILQNVRLVYIRQRRKRTTRSSTNLLVCKTLTINIIVVVVIDLVFFIIELNGIEINWIVVIVTLVCVLLLPSAGLLIYYTIILSHTEMYLFKTNKHTNTHTLKKLLKKHYKNNITGHSPISYSFKYLQEY